MSAKGKIWHSMSLVFRGKGGLAENSCGSYRKNQTIYNYPLYIVTPQSKYLHMPFPPPGFLT